jgi:hypothetical protein
VRFRDALHDPGCTVANKHHTLSGKARKHECRYAARKAARKLARNKITAASKVVNPSEIRTDAGADS